MTATVAATGRDPLTDRGRRTRQKLVAAARVVFEEKGFFATRMGDIAEQAGVSHGTVYTYFDTKEDLLAASVQQLVADIRASIRTAESDDPVERVWNANHRYLTAYLSHARLMSVVEQAGAADPQFAEIVGDLRRTHARRVASQIRKLQSIDLVPAHIHPDAASRALCAMVEGFARNWTDQVDSDLTGSTRILTELWVNALGLDAGSLSGPGSSTDLDWGSSGLGRGVSDPEGGASRPDRGSVGPDRGSVGPGRGSVGPGRRSVGSEPGASASNPRPTSNPGLASSPGSSAVVERARSAGIIPGAQADQETDITHMEASDEVHA